MQPLIHVHKLKSYILSGAGFLMISTLIVNIGNYGLNVILGRWLGPEGFADANILATIVMMLSFIAMGFQLIVARVVAELVGLNREDEAEQLTGYLQKTAVIASLIICSLLLIFSQAINQFLHLNSISSVYIMIFGIPFYFLLSVSRGYYQGICSFKQLANTYILEMSIRVIATIALLYLVKNYQTEMVALGFLSSFIISSIYATNTFKVNATISSDLKKKLVAGFFIISIYELSQILINNSDVILVKHYFDNYQAGLYASLALLGRAVFFATWVVVTILFPKVIQAEKSGKAHIQLFINALGIVAGIGAIMVIGCYLFDELIIRLAFGAEYLTAAPILWKYCLFTSFFACANVFVYYHMSLERYTPIYISVAIGILQIVLITLYHHNLGQVIFVQLLLMSLFLLIVTVYHLGSVRDRSRVYKSSHINSQLS